METNYNDKDDIETSKYIAIAKDQFAKLKGNENIKNEEYSYEDCRQSIENCLISNFLTNSELVDPILDELFTEKNLKNKGKRKSNRMDEEEYIRKFVEAYILMTASTDINKAFDDNINMVDCNELDLFEDI